MDDLFSKVHVKDMSGDDYDIDPEEIESFVQPGDVWTLITEYSNARFPEKNRKKQALPYRSHLSVYCHVTADTRTATALKRFSSLAKRGDDRLAALCSKVDSCLYFGEHTASRKPLHLAHTAGLFQRYLTQKMLILLSVIGIDTFYGCEDE